VAEVVAKYETTAFPKLSAKSVSNSRSFLRRFILPKFGGRTVASITRDEVEELISTNMAEKIGTRPRSWQS